MVPLKTTARPAVSIALLDRLVAAAPVRALLAPARDHEQRVVDRDAEADQRDQELDDRRDVGELGEAEQQQERGHDRDDRHDDRDDRQERREHEDQHDQRAESAEHRLEQHARAVAVLAAVLESASKPVRCTGAPATVAPSSAALARLLGVGVLAEGGVRVRAGDRRCAKVVRPSFETNASSPVEA